MGKKKSTMTESQANHFKVFGFMRNPHNVLLITEDGQELDTIEVESAEQAKEKFVSEELNQKIINKLGRTDFSTIWTDDPAGNSEIVDACRLMEETKKKDPETVESPEKTSPENTERSEPTELTEQEISPKYNIGYETSVHTKGIVFQTEVGGEFKNIPGKLLQIDDECRFFPERDPVNCDLWQVIAHPTMVSQEGEEENWLIQLSKIDTSKEEKKEVLQEPQFDTVNKTKIIEVECSETQSEREMKNLGRKIRELKAVALQTAAEFREDIKKLEKRFFEMCDGKSYTSMECTIVNDWNTGERKYIRPDTDEIARVEKIPYEEQQLNMNEDLEPPAEEKEVDGEEAPAEDVVENETTETQTDDFPPPDEDEQERAAEETSGPEEDDVCTDEDEPTEETDSDNK